MRNKKFLKIFDIVLLIIISLYSGLLFYQYACSNYQSDFPAHIKSAMDGESYSLMGILIYAVNSLFYSNIAIAALMVCLMIITIALASFLLRRLLGYFDVEDVSVWTIIPIGISSIFLCTIYVPKFWMKYYAATTHVTQPWHNSTYLLMRLVAIAVLLIYFKIEKKYMDKIEVKDLILFTISLVMVNAAKPNFILGFAPMMLIFLIIDFVKMKGKTFYNAVKFGSCVLVSLVVILLQSKILYVDDSTSGIAFTMEKFNSQFMTPEVWIMVAVNLAFPIVVTIALLSYEKRNSYSLRLLMQGWCMYIVARLQGIFLTETGMRAGDGNFSWGGYLFGYLLYIICISEWLAAKKKGIIKIDAVYYVGWTLYILSIVSGVIYFTYLYEGYYYIL